MLNFSQIYFQLILTEYAMQTLLWRDRKVSQKAFTGLKCFVVFKMEMLHDDIYLLLFVQKPINHFARGSDQWMMNCWHGWVKRSWIRQWNVSKMKRVQGRLKPWCTQTLGTLWLSNHQASPLLIPKCKCFLNFFLLIGPCCVHRPVILKVSFFHVDLSPTTTANNNFSTKHYSL